MKRIVIWVAVLLFAAGMLIAADSTKVNVAMMAALPGGQYANNVVPSVNVGTKLNMKYTFTLKEDVSMGSIFKDVKSFFVGSDNSYVCALINFDGIEDVTLVTKTNGAYAVLQSENDNMIMSCMFNNNMHLFRMLLAGLKGINLDTWDSSMNVYRIDALDSIVEKNVSNDKDYGMRYSFSLLDYSTKADILYCWGEEYVNYYLNGKYYIIMMPYKKDRSYEIEFQLDTKNVSADSLVVEMDFVYFKDYNSNYTVAVNCTSESSYLADSAFSHSINIKH